MKLLRKYIRELLAENKLSQTEIKALQSVKDGTTNETHASKALVFIRLLDMSLISGEVNQGQSYRKTRRGHDPVRYRNIRKMSITQEGESALIAGTQSIASEGDKFKKIIMQAIIDANGQPVYEHEMPGYNPKTFKLKGRYRQAFDELRGFGSDISALSTEHTNQGRVISHGPDFELIKGELGI